MNKRKYTINDQFFDKWSPEMAYVLGWIYSDGNLAVNRKRVKIGSCDLDILVRIRELLDSNYPIQSRLPCNRTKPQHTLLIDCEQVYNRLLLLGLTPRKSKTINFPKIPDKFFTHFLRGLIDGDGSIFVENRTFQGDKRTFLRCMITSASWKFLNDLQLKIHNFFSVKNKNLIKDKTAFFIRYSTKEAITILSYIYRNSKNNRLERKFIIYKNFLENELLNYYKYRKPDTLKLIKKYANISA